MVTSPKSYSSFSLSAQVYFYPSLYLNEMTKTEIEIFYLNGLLGLGFGKLFNARENKYSN